jgi:hypothetical protein
MLGKFCNPDATRLNRKRGIDFMEDDDQLPPWLAGNALLDAGDDEENRPTLGQHIGARLGMYAPPVGLSAPPPMPAVPFRTKLYVTD